MTLTHSALAPPQLASPYLVTASQHFIQLTLLPPLSSSFLLFPPLSSSFLLWIFKIGTSLAAVQLARIQPLQVLLVRSNETAQRAPGRRAPCPPDWRAHGRESMALRAWP